MRVSLAAHYYKLLWIASSQRDKFPGHKTEGGVVVPAWAKQERLMLLAEVNKERSRRGLPPAHEQDIRRGEAVGDPSYGKLLAEHCARVATGE